MHRDVATEQKRPAVVAYEPLSSVSFPGNYIDWERESFQFFHPSLQEIYGLFSENTWTVYFKELGESTRMVSFILLYDPLHAVFDGGVCPL